MKYINTYTYKVQNLRSVYIVKCMYILMKFYINEVHKYL
jgi:hypothetical protein